MPNTNPTDYTDCDCGDLCTSCGCSECGRKTDPDTRGPLTLVSGRVVQACAECRAAEAAEREAVPVEIEDVPTKAERTPTDAELLAERQAVAS